MTNEPELNPCQFCGGEMEWHNNPQGEAARCRACKTQVVGFWSDSPESFAERYNTRADQPLAVSVKPLEWVWIGEYETLNRAKCSFGYYTATQDEDSPSGRVFLELHLTEFGDCTVSAVDIPGKFFDPNDWEAAAQADYERRILSAITTRTEAEVRDEALEEAARSCDVVSDAFDKEWRGGPKCDQHMEGQSDGANDCAAVIRALKGETK